MKISNNEALDLNVYGMPAKLEHEEHEKTVGFFHSAKLFKDKTIRGYVEVTDPITRDRIRKGDLTHVSPNYDRRNYNDLSISKPLFREVSFTKNPYWDKCKITVKANKNNEKKYINPNENNNKKMSEQNQPTEQPEQNQGNNPSTKNDQPSYEDLMKMNQELMNQKQGIERAMQGFKQEVNKNNQWMSEYEQLKKEKETRLENEKKEKLKKVEDEWSGFYSKFSDKDENLQKDQKNKLAGIFLEPEAESFKKMLFNMKESIGKLQEENQNLKKRSRDSYEDNSNNNLSNDNNKAQKATNNESSKNGLDYKKHNNFNNEYQSKPNDLLKEFAKYTGQAINTQASKKLGSETDTYFLNKYGKDHEINKQGYSSTAFIPKNYDFSEGFQPIIDNMKSQINDRVQKQGYLPWDTNKNYF